MSASDENLLKAYFESHYEELCTIAYTYIQDRDEVEDIVQDFFYTMWEKKRLRKIQGSFMAYARRAIINRCLNQLKVNAKTQVLNRDEEIVDSADEDYELHIQREDYFCQLGTKLEGLPDRQREVLLLSVNDNMTYKDISAKLNLSINTIKTHIKLAYKSLRATK